nr:MAG TPA: hypothetical protein [Caudoviricetes sp.]
MILRSAFLSSEMRFSASSFFVFHITPEDCI